MWGLFEVRGSDGCKAKPQKRTVGVFPCPFYEAYRDDRNSPYTIINRVCIDEIITDSSGLRSYKLPQQEADRIERLLKGGDDSDIDSDDERVKNGEVADEDSPEEPPKRVFVSTRSRRSATRLQLFLVYNQTS